MLALPIFSAFGLISFGLCQTTVPVTIHQQVPPVRSVPRKVLTLNRCSHNVPSRFQVPDLLKYVGDIEDKKFQYLASVIGTLVKDELVFLYFSADGSVTYLTISVPENDNLEREILFHKDSYCISRITSDSMTLNFCKSKCHLHDNESGANLCVPRCCAPGAISFGSGKAVNDTCTINYWAEWKPEIYKTGNSRVYPQITVNDKIYEWNCSGDKYFESLIDKSSIRITSNGQVMLKNGNKWVEAFSGHMPYQFCIDGYWDQLETSVYDPRASSTILLKRCQSKEEEDSRSREEAAAIRTKIQIITIHIPCALIYLTVLIVYGSIWDKHHAHGWTIFGFATSQFLSYVFIIIVLSMFVFEDNADLLAWMTNGVCCTIGSMRHFFSISTYSWTLVLTFNVWEILSSVRPESSRSIGTRIICYVSFAVGVPTIVVFTALMLELFPPNENTIMPGYQTRCVVRAGTPYMLYVGSIHILLYTANLLFA
ncbi:unnamed protein product, partial [Allacma fusca]